MKKSLFVLLLCTILLAAAVLPAAGETVTVSEINAFLSQANETHTEPLTETPAETNVFANTVLVEIDVKDQGKILVELYPDAAPVTVENFLKLVDAKFYDGLTFHRIIDGFMVQGGCPLGNGTGGADQDIKGEFAANGVDNPLKHVRGVISMARSALPDSASSQFFIMHQDAPHLDGNYAAFGKVLSGMEIVDALCANTPVQDGNGTVLKADQPVITSIRRIEKP